MDAELHAISTPTDRLIYLSLYPHLHYCLYLHTPIPYTTHELHCILCVLAPALLLRCVVHPSTAVLDSLLIHTTVQPLKGKLGSLLSPSEQLVNCVCRRSQVEGGGRGGRSGGGRKGGGGGPMGKALQTRALRATRLQNYSKRRSCRWLSHSTCKPPNSMCTNAQLATCRTCNLLGYRRSQ